MEHNINNNALVGNGFKLGSVSNILEVNIDEFTNSCILSVVRMRDLIWCDDTGFP